MINLRVIKNFILLNVMFMFKINIKVKITPYKLLIINGEVINNNGGIINVEINELIIKMLKGHLESITLNVILIRRHEVILRML
jgi:hypothetical protein